MAAFSRRSLRSGDTIHLIYFTGDPKAGDVNYARSTDGGRTFAKAIRVNSEAASALAVGTIRGPRMAVGKDGRVHVAWMGSDRATPRGPGNSVPMLYTRLNDAGDAFEPQRNIIAEHPGLDGGGTVAADERGTSTSSGTRRAKRRKSRSKAVVVWVAQSTRRGKDLCSRSIASTADDAGVCACCNLDAYIDPRGALLVLYRTASERVHRDIHVARMSFDDGRGAETTVDHLEVGICVMSTASMAPPRDRHRRRMGTGEARCSSAALDANGQISLPLVPIGTGNNRKHPRLAVNKLGQTLVVWTEDTSWNKGGSIAWQLLDKTLKPVGPIGNARGLPTWGTAAVFPTSDGRFTIIY
jgi:hypothetical protein